MRTALELLRDLFDKKDGPIDPLDGCGRFREGLCLGCRADEGELHKADCLVVEVVRLIEAEDALQKPISGA